MLCNPCATIMHMPLTRPLLAMHTCTPSPPAQLLESVNLKFTEHKLEDNVGLLVALQLLGSPDTPHPSPHPQQQLEGASPLPSPIPSPGPHSLQPLSKSEAAGAVTHHRSSQPQLGPVKEEDSGQDGSQHGSTAYLQQQQQQDAAAGQQLQQGAMNQQGQQQGPVSIVVGNTHICFDPAKGDVKLGQIRTLFNRAAQLGEEGLGGS